MFYYGGESVEVALTAGQSVVAVIDAYSEIDYGEFELLVFERTDTEVCGNGLDDDQDRDLECEDTDCAVDPACLNTCPAVALAGTAPEIHLGSTAGRPNALSGSCGGDAAPEETFTWTAPADGRYTLSTAGSGFDTVLYALDGTCAGPELACSDDTAGIGLTSQIEVDLIAGQTIVIVADGYGATDRGALTLEIR